MGTPAPNASDFEDLDLSPADLKRLTLETHTLNTPSPEIEAAEKMLNPKDRKRMKTLMTGHKLRLIAEVKQGLPIKEICARVGISPNALTLICNDPTLQEVANSQHLALTKKFQAARFYHIADMALNEITPEKLLNLDPYRLAMIAAIMTDKGRLIEGQSTENISFKSLAFNIHATFEQLKERKAALLAVQAKREGTTSISGPASAQ